MERWQSGRLCDPGKVVYWKRYRGFESLSLRHLVVLGEFPDRMRNLVTYYQRIDGLGNPPGYIGAFGKLVEIGADQPTALFFNCWIWTKSRLKPDKIEDGIKIWNSEAYGMAHMFHSRWIRSSTKQSSIPVFVCAFFLQGSTSISPTKKDQLNSSRLIPIATPTKSRVIRMVIYIISLSPCSSWYECSLERLVFFFITTSEDCILVCLFFLGLLLAAPVAE